MAILRFEYGNSDQLLADALAIRHEVFVEEQGVPLEREHDGLDIPPTVHYVGYDEDIAACVARVRPIYFGKGGTHDAKIERVAVIQSHRGQRVGEAVMSFMLEVIAGNTTVHDAVLEAQTQAQDFYSRLGFVAEGDIFEDAGIPHIKMRKPIRTSPLYTDQYWPRKKS